MPSQLSLRIPHSPALRRLINRHNKESLLAVIENWFNSPDTAPLPRDPDEEDEAENVLVTFELYEGLRGGNKKKIVDRVVEKEWKGGLSLLQIAQLDMKYYQDHSTLKNWKALRLCWDEDHLTQSTTHTSISPTKLQSQLSDFLSPFFKHHVYVAPNPATSTTWIRIAVHDGLAPAALPPPANVVYLVHFLNSEYLLCGGVIRAEIKAYVVQSLLRAFHATALDEHDLRGKQILTLSQLLLHRDAQGPWSKYRLDQVDANPLDYHGKGKHSEEGVEGREGGYVAEEERGRIIVENQGVVERRIKEVDERFGWNRIEGVERVEVKLDFPYYDTPTDSEDFTMHIRFDGTNVMEGVRRLVPLGVAVVPLPEWLVEMPSLAANRVVVNKDGVVAKGL